MTIGVIGHFCLDVIHHPEGVKISGDGTGAHETRSYGGIFFAVAALANLATLDTTILPVFGVGKNEYAEVLERLSQYPNVDPSEIFRLDGPTNEVHLTYADHQRRIECSKSIAEPIPFKRIKPILDSDMILVNMISGFDITLETLDAIRMSVRDRHAPVYLDAHSLTLGIQADFTRFRRPLIDWRRWLFWLHAVQMNEEELQAIAVERFTEEQFVKQTTALNTRVLIVTRGERGCSAYIDERKQITRHDLPGHPVQRTVDATGCGDVFGAAYCAHYVGARNVLESLEFANRAAALNASFAGSTEIDRLSELRLQPSRESL